VKIVGHDTALLLVGNLLRSAISSDHPLAYVLLLSAAGAAPFVSLRQQCNFYYGRSRSAHSAERERQRAICAVLRLAALCGAFTFAGQL
jgi:hypothetical protein